MVSWLESERWCGDVEIMVAFVDAFAMGSMTLTHIIVIGEREETW